MQENKVKLCFRLTQDQSAGFPVGAERIWCRKEPGGYRVKNAPFFVDGLSFEDLITVRDLGSGDVELDQILERSGNSTIWMNFSNPDFSKAVLDSIRSLGCSIEGGVFPGYFSVNVPEIVPIVDVFDLLDKEINQGVLEVNYPSIRQERSE